MKQLGMMKKNGDYNYDAFKKYIEDNSSWIDLTQSQDEDEDWIERRWSWNILMTTRTMQSQISCLGF